MCLHNVGFLRTCNEAVRGDMGLDSLQGRRDKAKLKWWYKVATMPEHRYSRKIFVQEWNVKPRRGRQRKYWCKVVDHLFSSLGLDKAEWLEDIRKGSCSLKSFLGVAGEGIDERESGKFEEGLNSKVKLSLYRTFGKIVEFNTCDAEAEIMRVTTHAEIIWRFSTACA